MLHRLPNPTRPAPAPGGHSVALAATLMLLAFNAAAPACDINVGPGEVASIDRNVTANCITVDVRGVLIIDDATLTLTGPGISTIRGTVQLTESGSELAFTTRSHTVWADGMIKGEHDSARITVASGITLNNDTNIVGRLEISGPGNFANNGVVEANDSGTLLINVSGSNSVGGSSGDWKATDSEARLEFGTALDDNDTTISMSGNFCISDGAEIQIDELASLTSAFTTTGRLIMSSGTLDCQENVTMGSDGMEMSMTGGSIVVAAGMTFMHH